MIYDNCDMTIVTSLTILTDCDNYQQLWSFVTIINNCEFLLQLWSNVTILTILPLADWVWHPVSHVYLDFTTSFLVGFLQQRNSVTRSQSLDFPSKTKKIPTFFPTIWTHPNFFIKYPKFSSYCIFINKWSSIQPCNGNFYFYII